jgi:predicted nucleic acid-binding protein
MTGFDTTWLVDLEVRESPRHEGALRLFEGWRQERNSLLCMYHHIFLEFLHVVTDPARFEEPLSMARAIERIWFWIEQERVRVLYPGDEALKRGLMWMTAYGLGRKRLIDTQMAATYAEEGVTIIWSANPGDFPLFEVFELPGY